MNEQNLRALLKIGFEYAFLHEDWVEPWSAALDGISAERARWRPSEHAMGIWDIVLHVAVWNENIVARVQTGEPLRPDEGAWPPLPSKADEDAWSLAKQRLWDSFEMVRTMIEATPMNKLESAPYGLGDLLCRFIHSAYHVGQVVKIRECMGW
jgi:hypothetical protein